MSDEVADITQLLRIASRGDSVAQEELFRRVEEELRTIADKYMRKERPDHTLSTTVLVDEAFMRLVVGGRKLKWTDRAHFYRAAAKAMRNLLVDYARRRQRKRRGPRHVRIQLDPDRLGHEMPQFDLLALNEALDKLKRLDPRQIEVVELHHFGGHSIAETAKILDVSVATVKTDWASARAFLYRELTRGET
jgi:RNA polymerase sigma factor (TIGR02999 family)